MWILDSVSDFVFFYANISHSGHLNVELIDLIYSVLDLLIQALIWYLTRWLLNDTTKSVYCTLNVIFNEFVVVFELILDSLEQVNFFLQGI